VDNCLMSDIDCSHGIPRLGSESVVAVDREKDGDVSSHIPTLGCTAVEPSPSPAST
jgi:hypothetical protein